MTQENPLIAFDDLFEPVPDPSDENQEEDANRFEEVPLAFTFTPQGETVLHNLAETALNDLENQIITTRARMARAYLMACQWDETFFDKNPKNILGILSLYRKNEPDTFRVDVEAPAGDEEIVQASSRIHDLVLDVLKAGVEGFEAIDDDMDDLAYQMGADMEEAIDELSVDFLNEDSRQEAEKDQHLVREAQDKRLFLIRSMADKMLNLVLDVSPEETPSKPTLQLIRN